MVLQKNVDDAVKGLKAKGITAVGAVCHVSDAQQRKSLIDTAVKVRIGGEGGFSLSDGLHCVVRFLLLLCSAIPSGLLAVDVVPNLVALGIKLRRLQMCIRNAGLVVLRY